VGTGAAVGGIRRGRRCQPRRPVHREQRVAAGRPAGRRQTRAPGAAWQNDTVGDRRDVRVASATATAGRYGPGWKTTRKSKKKIGGGSGEVGEKAEGAAARRRGGDDERAGGWSRAAMHLRGGAPPGDRGPPPPQVPRGAPLAACKSLPRGWGGERALRRRIRRSLDPNPRPPHSNVCSRRVALER